MEYPSHEIQDCQLIQQTAGGDAQAFTQLYDRYANLVFSVALQILPDREDARDVLQQVFLKLFSKASLYHPDKGKPATWLASLTRNQALDRLRHLKSRRSLDEKLNLEAAVEKSPHQNQSYAFYSDEAELLHRAMTALRPEEFHVLHLAYFGGLSRSEISLEIGKPLGSVKALIRRSLLKLRLTLHGTIHQMAAPPRRMTAVPV